MRLVVGVLLVLTATVAARPARTERPGWMDAPRLMRAETALAMKVDDWEAAWRLNAAGRALQPGHTGLIRQAIEIADKAGNARRLHQALDELASAGSSADLGALKTAAQIHAAELASLRARFAANDAPVGSAKVAADIPIPDVLIEGITFDPRTKNIYLGSVTERTIYRVDPVKPGEVKIFADKKTVGLSVFGMAIDAEARLLYAALGTVPQTGPIAEAEFGTLLSVFNLDSGIELVREGIDGAKQIADLTLIGKTGYATDSGAPRIYRFGPKGGLELFTADPRFVSLQGIAPLGNDLIVADYAVGLWRVSRQTGKVTLVRPPEGSQSLLGIDGLAAGPGRVLYAVRNGAGPHAVLRLEFSLDGELTGVTPELRGHPLFDEPTLMTVSGGKAFLVARSQWPLFPADGSPPARPRRNPVVLTWQPAD